MAEPLTYAVIAILVFLVSFTFANVGLGGGGLYVPILLLLYVDNDDLVVPISLSLAAATAISSTLNHWRKGFVDVRIDRSARHAIVAVSAVQFSTGLAMRGFTSQLAFAFGQD
ncbi:MAG: TSUP family transporter, partial [Candidatus Thermoplasmatota archaeon]